jgi:hypothetical protein
VPVHSSIDIAVSKPALRTVSTSSTPPACETTVRPPPLDADTRVRTDTLLHLESASFRAANRTLEKSHRCRSGAPSAYLIKRRTSHLVKARGQPVSRTSPNPRTARPARALTFHAPGQAQGLPSR